MSSHPVLPRRWIRTRRILSVVLSVATGLAATVILVVSIARPSTYLSDGTFGMPPLLAFIVNSFGYLPATAIAAVLIVGGLPRSPGGSLRERLPMILAIIAICLLGACIVLPVAMVASSFLIGFLPL